MQRLNRSPRILLLLSALSLLGSACDHNGGRVLNPLDRADRRGDRTTSTATGPT
ncbi:hypothetical protein [Enhygromyxa salina]|uniref:Lipoprotein n=1 Tax=Enhygromyxa salina TaxID=215803 RepID=A0A2S9YQ45_9BACT|nr:hypothetical protein [Enhygromyxa salina]PRQ07213.1 hypothetical protein ENSA7_29200 [Enhygromyxa salina]